MAKLSTRDHLLQVGLERLHEHGYTATGIQEILESAGVPKGSFYHHFGSKEEFARQVVLEYVNREVQHIEKVLKNPKLSPLKRLRQYFKELIKIYGHSSPISGCLLGKMSLEVSNQSELIRMVVSGSFETWQKEIEDVLCAAVDQKEAPSNIRPAEIAAYLLNGWQGAVLRSQVEKSDKPLETFLALTFSHLLPS
jgi:TetR/AcrR family transcriptional regulator, transcriptional repressor for nem operon